LQGATPEELAAIQRLQLHTTCNAQGWTALHYAAATHKASLVQQLLQLGADPAAPDAQHGFTPLHLACLGRLVNKPQLKKLLAAAPRTYNLQVS
jgi:ankyrin repeat protein